MTQVLEEIMPRGALKREIKKQSPNTRRFGCPSPSVLREMAGDSQTHTKLFYHVLLCGACVEDFERFRRQRAQQRSPLIRRLLATAAGMLLTLGIWWCLSKTLIVSQYENKSQRQPATFSSNPGLPNVANSLQQRSTKEDLFAKRQTLNAAIPVEIVESQLPVVDYTVFSATRDAAPELSEAETLSLRRERMKLRIHLPLGSEEGKYRVRLQRKTDARAVMSLIARASRSNNFTLTIEGDFGRLRSGAYSMEILPPGYMGELPYYPVELIDEQKGAKTKGQSP